MLLLSANTSSPEDGGWNCEQIARAKELIKFEKEHSVLGTYLVTSQLNNYLST